LTLSNVSLDLSAYIAHCTLQQWFNFESLSRETVPCVLTLGWQLRTCPRYSKPWVGAQGHYIIGSWSATIRHFVEYSGEWMHLDPKKHLITSSFNQCPQFLILYCPFDFL
jgi:hypothetical protein